jgi:anti-sigma B factor antagonist
MMVAPQVDEGVERLISLQPETLTIDLRGLSFMDSSGIHALIVAERKCRKRGIHFVIVRGVPAIDRLLSLCGLEERFEIVGEPADVAVDTPAL